MARVDRELVGASSNRNEGTSTSCGCRWTTDALPSNSTLLCARVCGKEVYMHKRMARDTALAAHEDGKDVYGRAETVGSQFAILCLVVEYVLKPPRVPVRFSK